MVCVINRGFQHHKVWSALLPWDTLLYFVSGDTVCIQTAQQPHLTWVQGHSRAQLAPASPCGMWTLLLQLPAARVTACSSDHVQSGFGKLRFLLYMWRCEVPGWNPTLALRGVRLSPHWQPSWSISEWKYGSLDSHSLTHTHTKHQSAAAQHN